MPSRTMMLYKAAVAVSQSGRRRQLIQTLEASTGRTHSVQPLGLAPETQACDAVRRVPRTCVEDREMGG